MLSAQKTQHIQSGAFQLGRTIHGLLDELLASQARESGRIGQSGTVRKLPLGAKACATVTISNPTPEKKSVMSQPAVDAVGELLARARQLSVEPWPPAKIRRIESEDQARLAFGVSSALQREFMKEEYFVSYWRRARRQ